MGEGLCATKAFGARSLAIFEGRAYDIVDPIAAVNTFNEISSQINQLGKRLVRARAKCELEAGMLPCGLLEFPKNALACQLSTRLQEVVNYVGNKCNDEWNQYYGQVLMTKLIAFSQPADGSECIPEHHDDTVQIARKYNKIFQEENGIGFNDHVKEKVDSALTAIRAEQAATKQLEREQKQERRQEVQEKKEARLAERARIQEERKQKIQEREDRNQAKLLRQQNAARAAYEAAMEELKRQQAELMKLHVEVQNLMGSESIETGPVMLMDATDDVYLEVEEVEEDEAEIDERRFGMGLENERIEFTQFKEMHMPNYHVTCNMPGAHQFADLERQATDRFNTLLEISQEEAARNSGNSRDLLAARLRTRFNEVLDFILSQRRLNVCDDLLEVRCYDLDAVFGDLEVSSIERLIQHSTQLVEQLELQCPRVLFATYYMTLNGKADRLL